MCKRIIISINVSRLNKFYIKNNILTKSLSKCNSLRRLKSMLIIAANLRTSTYPLSMAFRASKIKTIETHMTNNSQM